MIGQVGHGAHFEEVSMKKLVPIPPESLKRLKKDDLKDFGHQFVKLKDGRVFAQAVASEGCLIQVKGFREIPFVETDIESAEADGEPWNFRRRAVRTRTPPTKMTTRPSRLLVSPEIGKVNLCRELFRCALTRTLAFCA